MSGDRLDAIDAALAAWNERLRQVDDNLLALEADPTFQVLSGALTGRRAGLEGASRVLVEPALDAFQALFEHRAQLNGALERAQAARASVSFWSGDDRLDAIDALLHGPAITLATRDVPLAERSLLAGSAQPQRTTLDALLSRMVAAFERVRDVVTAVRLACDSIEPQLAQAEAALVEVRARAQTLGVEAAVADDLAAIANDLSTLRATSARDPIGARTFARNASDVRVATLRTRLDAFARQRASLELEVARARRLFERLKIVHADAVGAVEVARRSYVEAATLAPPIDDARSAALGPWLEKIAGAFTEHRVHAVEIGLAKWFDEAGVVLRHDAQLRDTATSIGARAGELVGRVAARSEQLETWRGRGVDTDDLHALLAAAERACAASPMSVSALEFVVDSLERALSTRSRRTP